MATPSRTIQSVSNTELYNRWAEVYDTDGNILQALDDLLLPTLLTKTFSLLSSSTTSTLSITITELGAGTGRNTLKLLSPTLLPSSSNISIQKINALDLSPSMLEIAKKRCSALQTTQPAGNVPALKFHEFDALNPSKYPEVLEDVYNKADLILSTLVLEHLPISAFFSTCASLLSSSPPSSPSPASPPAQRYLVLSNMHPSMGSLSRAGFSDPHTGEKLQGMSYVYGIQETIDEARKWGFEIVGEMMERGVVEKDLEEGRVGERGRKWIENGCTGCWYGGVFKFVGLDGGEGVVSI